jgi:transcriptional regulator with XRE-family HTH domain
VIARTSQPYGPLLALLREKRGLTQSQLAALGGITRKAVSRYETGTRSVPEKRFASLCAVLGYTPPEVEAWLLAFRTLPGSTTPGEATESEPTGLPPELARASRKALAELKEAIAAEAAPRFGRALLAASWRRERKQAEALGRKLLALPARLRPALLVVSAPYRSWAVIEWLCHASEKAAARDPRLSLNLAKVALQATEASTGPEASKLRSYAWGYIGNAQRVGNDYRSADRAFAGARSLWD